MQKCLLGLLAALIAAQASAQTLHRCQEKGRTVLSNTPCPEAPPSALLQGAPSRGSNAPSVTNGGSDGYQTPYGTWRGQVQYQAAKRGQHVAEAHAVVPLVLRIEPQGKITGASTDNGCKLLGIATPSSMTPLMAQVDITFSNCHFTGYNRRFTGHVSVDPRSLTANFSLNAHDVFLANTYNVKATMRR